MEAASLGAESWRALVRACPAASICLRRTAMQALSSSRRSVRCSMRSRRLAASSLPAPTSPQERADFIFRESRTVVRSSRRGRTPSPGSAGPSRSARRPSISLSSKFTPANGASHAAVEASMRSSSWAARVNSLNWVPRPGTSVSSSMESILETCSRSRVPLRARCQRSSSVSTSSGVKAAESISSTWWRSSSISRAVAASACSRSS